MVQKDDRVVAIRDIQATRDGSYSHYLIPEGAEGVVTRFRSANRICVRFPRHYTYVLMVDTDAVQLLTSDVLAEREARAAAERKAAEPQDGDIMPDDPRLAWLWKKAAKLARMRNLCSEYDRFCDDLDIPGRPRDFTLKFKLGEAELNATVQATSKNDAAAKLLEMFKNSSELKLWDAATSTYNTYPLAG